MALDNTHRQSFGSPICTDLRYHRGRFWTQCRTLVTTQDESENNSAAPAEQMLDTSGLTCPEPLMLVRNRVRELASGSVLHVLATDPSTERDFTNFCRFMGHELKRHEHSGGIHEYWIVKG